MVHFGQGGPNKLLYSHLSLCSLCITVYCCSISYMKCVALFYRSMGSFPSAACIKMVLARMLLYQSALFMNARLSLNCDVIRLSLHFGDSLITMQGFPIIKKHSGWLNFVLKKVLNICSPFTVYVRISHILTSKGALMQNQRMFFFSNLL